MRKIWVLGVVFIEFEYCSLKKNLQKLSSQEIQERSDFSFTEYFQAESVAWRDAIEVIH